MKKIELPGQSKLRARLKELEPIVTSNEKEQKEYQRGWDIFRDCYSHALYLRQLKDPLFEPAEGEELFEGQNKLLARLNELEKIVNANKKERAEYEACLKVYRDNENVMDYAVTSAREEGILIGEERGLKKGRMEGRKEGLLEVAHLMKQNDFSFEQIKLGTGLSDEEIKNL